MTVVSMLNQQQLLAMPESDYMNPAQRAFFASACWKSSKNCCSTSMR